MSKVFCYKQDSYEGPALEAAVEAIFAQSKCALRINKDSTVLIKPNLLAKHQPEACVTTNPAVVRAVITALKRRGAQNIILADSCGGAYTASIMRGIYKASGLDKVCADEGVEMYCGCEAFTKATSGRLVHEFDLIEPIKRADFIVNCPKLKTHVMTGMSCAVKNIFGCVAGMKKAELHMRFPQKRLFGEMLVDLYELIRPDICIVDGIMAMQGDGPAGGTPCKAGVIIGGEDGYAIDLAICRIMGLGSDLVPFLAAAHARDLCTKSFEGGIVGDKLKPIAGYELPKSYARLDFGSKVPKLFRWAVPYVQKLVAPHPVINTKSCIGCAKCAEICPQNIITITNGTAHIAKDGCIRCFCCHEMCPVKAISVKRSGIFKM